MAGWSDIENDVASSNPPPKTSNKQPHLTSLLSANDPDLGLIKLKQCFDQCDEDKDGYINQDELKKLCQLLNMKQLESSKGVKSLFHALDDTSRGKIAFVDFLRYKYIYTKSPLSLSSDTDTKMISDQTNSSISPPSSPNSSDKYLFDSEYVFESDATTTSHTEQSSLIVSSKQRSEVSPAKPANYNILNTLALLDVPLESSPDSLSKHANKRPHSANHTKRHSHYKRPIRPNSADYKPQNRVVKKELGNPTNLSSEYAASNPADPKTTTDTTSAHHATDESSSLQTCLILHTSDDNDPSSPAKAAYHPPIQGKTSPTSASLLLSQTRVRRILNTSTLESFTNPNRHSYSTIPLEALPPAPVSVIQQICSDSSDYIPFSDLLTLLQFLGFDPVDIAEDLNRVLQEVPRDGQDRLSVIGISMAMERILLDQEEVPDESLLRKIALKLYQQEIIMSRRSHQNTLTDRNQLYDTLELNRDENRQLLTVSEEQIHLETVHWSNKLNEEKEKHKQKLVALEESKNKELEVIVDKTSKAIEEKDKHLASLEEESERLKEELRDLKYDKESLSEMLKESRNETLVLEHMTESLKQQLQDHQLSHGYPEQQIDVDNGVGSKLLEEKTRLSESLKSLQDKYDEQTAEKERLQQQVKFIQNKMKQSVKNMLIRPSTTSRVRESPSLPRGKALRHKSLVDSPSTENASPEVKRKVNPNLMGEMMQHDLQEVERKRFDTLEHQLLELENSKRYLESKLTNNDMETQRQRQTHRKEKLVLQNKVSELTAECSHLNELKSKSEDRQMETQTLISKKTQEISELQKQLVGINQQVVHLEMMNQTFTSQMENLEQSKQDEEARGSELVRENIILKLRVEEIALNLSSNKADFEAKLSEIEKQLAESEEKFKSVYTENEMFSTQFQIEMENAKQTLIDAKRGHLNIVEDLEFRVKELETLLEWRTENHMVEAEKMSAEIGRAQEHEKLIREAKIQLERNLNEAQQSLELVVKEKQQQQERAKEALTELTNRLKLEKENLEKQNKLDKTFLEEQLFNLRWEVTEKMEQAHTSHDSMLQEVRSEYENQILTLHSQIQTLEQEKRSTETDASYKITTLETNLSHHINEIERLEKLRKDSETTMRKVEKAIKEDLKIAVDELDSVKNELYFSSEAYLEQIHQLNLKISSAEQNYAELTHYSASERSELEESIRIYGEQERVLVDDYETKISELGAKFDNEKWSIQSTLDASYEECEYLKLQLEETNNTLSSTREQHELAIRRIKGEIKSLEQNLSDVKKEKEIVITQLRNQVMKLERNISTLVTTNEENLVLVTRKGEQIETLSGQLKQTKTRNSDLQKELSDCCTELESEGHKHKLLEEKLGNQLEKLKFENKKTGEAKESQKNEFTSRYNSLIEKHQSILNDKHKQIYQLEESILELKSFIAGEDLQEEWKKYIEQQHTVIQDLDRQVRSKDSINQQMVIERENKWTIKNKLNQLEDEKSILFNLLEELSYLIDADNII